MENRQATRPQLIFIGIVNLIILFITFNLISNGTMNPVFDESSDPTSTSAFIPTPIPRLEVVIAVQNIPRGSVITPDRVATLLYPIDVVPAGAFDDMEFIIGKIAATDIYREEVILARKLVESMDSLGRTGSDLTAILQPGEVALTVYIPAENVVSGLQSGDRLDLIYTLPDGSIIISDVLLIGVGDIPERFFAPVPTPTRVMSTQVITFAEEQASRPTTLPSNSPDDTPERDEHIMLTIAVSRQDAVTIDWAINETVPVRVIARAARTQGLPPVVPVNADNVLELYSQPTFTPIPTVDFPATDMALLRNANATATSLVEDMIALSTTSPENFATQSAIATDIHRQATIDPSNPMPKGISAVQLTATALANLLSASPTATPTP